MKNESKEAMKAFVRARKAEYVRFAAAAVAANPDQGPQAYSDADLGQMIEGYVGVISEAMDGQSKEIVTFFLETVVPGLVAGGNRFDVVVHTTVGWAVRMADDFARKYTGADREEILEWYSGFLAGYIADIARVGAKAEFGV